MSRSFYKDYNFGIENENLVIDKIRTFFQEEINKTNSKFCKWDFEGTNNVYELKTRTCNKNKYPTTLIGKDKVIHNGKTQIFLFNFQDGLYYIQYDPEIFKDFKCEMFKRIQRGDYNDKEKLYYFIPVEVLKKID